MDQVVDSLNEIMPSSVLRNTPMTDDDDDDNHDAVVVNSPVIAEAGGGGGGDLPSFHYFVSEQAKSMLALQELQNKVGALLEFRDLVIETFPQLDQSVPNLQSQSSSKWEPGIRVKRKLGQQLRDPDVLMPSLLPRYRSNSQGKGSSPRSEMSGSTASSSAIQDSGFCTESSKDHLSAVSGRSKSRETAEELFSLLDNIHRKGTRLKLEVECLKSRLHREDAAASSLTGTKRRCKSLDNLISTNNAAENFAFECALRTAVLEGELDALKQERDLMTKKMNEIESEHLGTLAEANRLEEELVTAAEEKRYLEERLQDAIHSKSFLNGHREPNNFLAHNQWTNVQTPFAKCQLLKLMQVFKDTNRNATSTAETAATVAHAIPSSSIRDDYFRLRSRSQESSKIVRPTNPIMKELNNNTYQSQSHKTYKMTSTEGSTVTRTSAKDFNDTVDRKQPDLGQSYGKPDVLIGFSSGHQSSLERLSTRKEDGGVTLSKEKVLSILNKSDVKELRCFLLTLSYQVEALSVHVQQISKSRTNVFQQLNRYKFENEDLKLELKKKEIELEGTKAQKRMLEQKRDVKFSYSTSDLVTNTAKMTTTDTRKTDPALSYFISDLASMSGTLSVTLPSSTSRADKCDKTAKSDSGGGSCQRAIVSKIPLKTCSSKQPNKSIYSGKKTLTSFKECLSAPSHNSCISSTSSSLNK